MPASPALDSRSPVSERVAVVIPTLNEAESIAAVISALPRHLVEQIIVADGGSTDGTPQIARGAGAEVIAVGPGYGRACLAGAQAAGDASVLVFMDGDGADDPSAIEGMVSALRSGNYDFVIGSRTRGKREASSMARHQILAGIVMGGLLAAGSRFCTISVRGAKSALGRTGCGSTVCKGMPFFRFTA